MDIPDRPGTAVWDSKARILTIDFADERQQRFRDLEHFSEEMLWVWHDLAVVGDVRVDEAGREHFPVLEV